MCVVDHGVNEGEPVDEQYREQVCDPEPEGQYLDQDFPKALRTASSIPSFDAYFVPVL